MDLKIEINRLAQDELFYELKCRGVVTEQTVETGRKTLRELMRLEKSSSYITPAYPFKYADDEAAVTAKLAEVELILDGIVTDDVKKFKKVATKLAYLYGRINRSKPITKEEIAGRSNLLVQIISLVGKYREKMSTVRTAQAISEQLFEFSVGHPGAHSSVLGVHSDSSEESEVDEPTSASLELVKPIPVRQWNLSFSGDPSKSSLSAFLQRVEELRVARNVGKHILFQSALDLFSGDALIWYRANRKSFSNWEELVVGLREQFQAADYNDRLLSEIKARTQGPKENIGMYVSVMQNLFSRLSIQVPEETRLHMVVKNLHPNYRSALWSMELRTFGELLRVGRKFEASRIAEQGYVPPPRKSAVLEPDLAYLEATNPTPTCSAVQGDLGKLVSSQISCQLCDKKGHTARQCYSLPKNRCSRCDRPLGSNGRCTRCSPSSNAAPVIPRPSSSGNASRRN